MVNKKIYIVNNERTPDDRYGVRYSDLKTVFETIQQKLQEISLGNEDIFNSSNSPTYCISS